MLAQVPAILQGISARLLIKLCSLYSVALSLFQPGVTEEMFPDLVTSYKLEKAQKGKGVESSTAQ